MSEPEKDLDPQQDVETTPEVEAAATPVQSQPAEVKPAEPEADYKALYDTEVSKAKRHLEQMAGKDKLIKELQERKIVEAFQPAQSVEPERDYEDYEEQPKRVVQQTDPNQQAILQLTVRNTVRNNISEMREKYRQRCRLNTSWG